VLGDPRVDLVDLRPAVAKRPQRQRHGHVHDRHLPAADELLELDQREVGLDARRVAVHQERDRAGGCEHRGLRVAVAVRLAELDRVVPGAVGGTQQLAVRDQLLVDLVRRVPVLAHHVVVRVAVLGVAVVRARRVARDLR
jgi:hypothetical protein